MRVAVIVPAFNEEGRIAATVRSVPTWVDHVFVIDDASEDRTSEEARQAASDHVEVIRHDRNRGVGAAIRTGYARAQELGVDAAAVMAGDGQMHPDDLPALLAALIDQGADYVKGNRFTDRSVLQRMPVERVIGNIVLSLATKVTSGYWHVFDSQCGYTVASRRAIEIVVERGLFPRYGYPNDLLARMKAARLRVVDVPVQAVYGPNWRSGINLSTVVYPISWVLISSWAKRVTA